MAKEFSQRTKMLSTALVLQYLSYVQLGMDEIHDAREIPLIRERYCSKLKIASLGMQDVYRFVKNTMRSNFNISNFDSIMSFIADTSDEMQDKVETVRNILRGRFVMKIPYNLVEAETRIAMSWLFLEFANQALEIMGAKRQKCVTEAECVLGEIYDDIKKEKFSDLGDIVEESELAVIIRDVESKCLERAKAVTNNVAKRSETPAKQKPAKADLESYLRGIAERSGCAAC